MDIDFWAKSKFLLFFFVAILICWFETGLSCK